MLAMDSTFSKLSDDIILQIFYQLEDDPRNWARLCCVCTKFNTLITSICCKSKCISSFQSMPSEVLSLSTVNGGWASLYKIAVCCPGILHAGVLLDNSDFGLQRELGPTENYYRQHGDEHRLQILSIGSSNMVNSSSSASSSTKMSSGGESSMHATLPVASNKGGEIVSKRPWASTSTSIDVDDNIDNNHEFGGWSLYDDLYFDTIYDNSESSTPMEVTTGVANLDSKLVDTSTNTEGSEGKREITGDANLDSKYVDSTTTTEGNEAKRRRLSRIMRSHLASGGWSLSREQGNKLLGSRFRYDCLYISEWPGCVHIEEKRSYRLFRGIFNNFKTTRVWRTINDGNRGKIDLKCAFCSCKETWDLHSAFCLKRGFGFHDDGEPVVRAYVCENGHVSGAWTDFPLYV